MIILLKTQLFHLLFAFVQEETVSNGALWNNRQDGTFLACFRTTSTPSFTSTYIFQMIDYQRVKEVLDINLNIEI